MYGNQSYVSSSDMRSRHDLHQGYCCWEPA